MDLRRMCECPDSHAREPGENCRRYDNILPCHCALKWCKHQDCGQAVSQENARQSGTDNYRVDGSARFAAVENRALHLHVDEEIDRERGTDAEEPVTEPLYGRSARISFVRNRSICLGFPP